MARTGQFVEEWELEAADDTFENAGEDVSWVEGVRQDYSPDDTEEPKIMAVPYDWRRHRSMITPLEGAHQEEQNLEYAADDEGDDKSDNSRNDTDTNGSVPNDRRHPSTGGDKFQAMEDRSGDGETYYYDEDLTRTGERDSELRDRTASDADLIFRTSRLSDGFRVNSFFRYLIVAIIAFGIGLLLGVLIDMATNKSCGDAAQLTQTTTPTTTGA